MGPGPTLSVERMTRKITEPMLKNTLSQCILREVLIHVPFVEKHSGQEMDFNLMIAKLINTTFDLMFQVQKRPSASSEQKTHGIN